MNTFSDQAVVDYRLPITNCIKQPSDCRLPIATQFRLPIVTNKRKLARYHKFPYFCKIDNKQTNRHTRRRQAGRQTDRQTTDRQIGMTGEKTGRQKDRQTDRQEDKQRDDRTKFTMLRLKGCSRRPRSEASISDGNRKLFKIS